MNSVLAQARHPKLSYRKEQRPDYEHDNGPSGYEAKGSRSRPIALTSHFTKTAYPEPPHIKRGFVLFCDLLWAHADVILSRSESPDGKGSLTHISNTHPGIKLP